MKIITLSGILLLNIIIQASVFPYIRIFGVKPDSLIAIVISYALFNGSSAGAIIGFCGGMLQDILFGKYLGFYALEYMVVGYIAGLVYQKIYIDRLFLPMFFCFAGYLIKELMMVVFTFFIGVDFSFSSVFFHTILPGAVYTAILMIVVHFAFYRLHRLKYMTKKWKIGTP